jgi:hypothetical protein
MSINSVVVMSSSYEYTYIEGRRCVLTVLNSKDIKKFGFFGAELSFVAGTGTGVDL